MKKLLLLTFFFLLGFESQAQFPSSWATAEVVPGGINVNAHIFHMMGTSYLGFTYTIEGTTVKVQTCYFESPLALPSDYTVQCFIPIAQPELYNVEVRSYWSLNETECDYNSFNSYAFIPLSAPAFSKSSNSVLLSPNPTNGEVVVQTENIEILSVKFYNSLGQLIKTTKNGVNDVSDFQSGIYNVLIETENGLVSKRLIVTH